MRLRVTLSGRVGLLDVLARGVVGAWLARKEGPLGTGRKTGPSGPAQNASMHFELPDKDSKLTSAL